MVLAWLLVGAATAAAATTALRSRQARGQRLMFNGRVGGWAVVPWVSVGPTMALAWEQARESAGPGLVVLVSAVVAVTVVLVGGWVWHNRYRAGRARACLVSCGSK
jgi:uncharacterized membrane protein